jgi:hypothetical protein
MTRERVAVHRGPDDGLDVQLLHALGSLSDDDGELLRRPVLHRELP